MIKLFSILIYFSKFTRLFFSSGNRKKKSLDHIRYHQCRINCSTIRIDYFPRTISTIYCVMFCRKKYSCWFVSKSLISNAHMFSFGFFLLVSWQSPSRMIITENNHDRQKNWFSVHLISVLLLLKSDCRTEIIRIKITYSKFNRKWSRNMEMFRIGSKWQFYSTKFSD